MGWMSRRKAAARQIRFKPAQQDGQPVDSTAIVHIVFAIGILKGGRKCARARVLVSRLMLAGTLAGSISAQTTQTADQTQPQAGAGAAGAPVVTVDQAIDHVIAREHDEIATIRRFSPIIETYIQDMKSDKEMGAIPGQGPLFPRPSGPGKRHRGQSMLHRAKRQTRCAQSDCTYERPFHFLLCAGGLSSDDLYRHQRL